MIACAGMFLPLSLKDKADPWQLRAMGQFCPTEHSLTGIMD